MIQFTIQNHVESLDGIFQRDELAWSTSEDLSDLERLTQETLDLSCACYCQLVVFRQLVHAQNGNDILQRLVILQNFLQNFLLSVETFFQFVDLSMQTRQTVYSTSGALFQPLTRSMYATWEDNLFEFIRRAPK